MGFVETTSVLHQSWGIIIIESDRQLMWDLENNACT